MIKIQMPLYLEVVPKYFFNICQFAYANKKSNTFLCSNKKSFLVSIGDFGQKPPREKCIK